MSKSLATQSADYSAQWGIKAFADMFGVTPRTIRFYEDKGLLSPRRESGVRVFGPRDRQRFDAIMRGKRLGFSLDDIKAVFDVTNGKITDRTELLRRRQNFEAVTQGLARRRDDLQRLAQDMKQVIDIIDEFLQTAEDTNDVSTLAERYQAAFDQTLTTNPYEFVSASNAASKKTNA